MSHDGAVFELGDITLKSGVTLANAQLIYKTYGTLAPDRSNAVLYPTSYGAQHADIEWLVKPGGILDSSRFFVVIVNQLGNGLSTSPSQRPELAGRFIVSHFDNVAAQACLLREALGIDQLALVYGWSMGAQQAYHWAVIHPDRVQRIAAVCGTARTSDHNIVFLRSLEAALHADPTWDGTRFTGTPERGYRTFARIYASWAASQAFYRQRIYRELGYGDLEAYLTRAWEPSYRRRDPLDLLSMLRTWIDSDVSNDPRHDGDLAAALGSIRAKTLVLPSATDLYFTPEDCAAEAALIPNARLLTIPSIWGHRAGNPFQNPEDARFIRSAIEELLAV
jgi:homoserine O-acetyltransferase